MKNYFCIFVSTLLIAGSLQSVFAQPRQRRSRVSVEDQSSEAEAPKAKGTLGTAAQQAEAKAKKMQEEEDKRKAAEAAKKLAEEKAKESAEAKARAKKETEDKYKMEAEMRAKAEADARAKIQAEILAQQEQSKLRADDAARRTATQAVAAQGPQVRGGVFAPFYVYLDGVSKQNKFYPTGWMGDFGDIKVLPSDKSKVRSGETSFKVTYTPRMSQKAGWVGIYWQYPANNWGDKAGGFNLTGASRLTFWACGERGGEVISEFKVGGINGEFPDSDFASIGPIELSKKWQKYTIELAGRDLTNIIGGFCFAASKDDNPNGFTIYIDDVMFE